MVVTWAQAPPSRSTMSPHWSTLTTTATAGTGHGGGTVPPVPAVPVSPTEPTEPGAAVEVADEQPAATISAAARTTTEAVGRGRMDLSSRPGDRSPDGHPGERAPRPGGGAG